MSLKAPSFLVMAAAVTLASATPAAAADPAKAPQLAQAITSEPPPPGKAPAYDAAFKAMQEDPGNSDKAIKFAEVAATVGDFEGAIGALERVLMFNPELATVRAQLGILYYKLGAQARAQEYLTRALQRDLQGPLSAQARETLELSQKALSNNRWSGSVGLGIRGQTNVNAGPSSGTVRIINSTIPLPNTLRAQGDGNLAGVASVSHVYDPKWVSGTTWESNGSVYGAKQFNVSELDLFFGSFDTGPRFFVPAIADTFSLRPYFRVDDAVVSAQNYFTGFGGGLSFNAPLSGGWSLNGGVEAEQFQYYKDDTLRARLDDKTGPMVSLSLTPFYEIADNQAAALVFRAARVMANQDYETAWRYTLQPNYYYVFDPGWTRQPWRLNAYFAHIRTDYKSPDNLVDSTMARSDREWDIGASLTIGIDKSWSALIQIQQAWIDSNIPNYRYDNFSGAVMMVWSF